MNEKSELFILSNGVYIQIRYIIESSTISLLSQKCISYNIITYISSIYLIEASRFNVS